MAFSIDHLTWVISIPQSDMTFVSGTLYEFDAEQFSADLLAWQGTPVGMITETAFNRTAISTIAGVSYVRTFEILAPYTIEFEDGQYAVRLVGNNNNLFDEGVIVRNQVSVIPTNSAGLIVRETGVSGLTPAESTALLDIDSNIGTIQGDIATLQASVTSIEADIVTIKTDQGTMSINLGLVNDNIDVLRKILQNRKTTNPNTGVMTVYDDDDTTPFLTAQIWEDIAMTQPYRGSGIEEQERLA